MSKTVTFDVLALAKTQGFGRAEAEIKHLSSTTKHEVGLMSLALSTVGPAIIPIGAAAVGAGLAFGGLGAAGILAFAGIKDEMKRGTPIGSQYLIMQSMITTDLAELKHTAAGGVLNGFKSAIQKIQPLMPAVNHEIKILAEKFGDIVSHVLPALVQLFIQAGPLMNTFADYVGDIATKFENWSNSAGPSSGVRSFLDWAKQNMPGIENTFKDIAGALGKIILALGPTGGFSLTAIGKFAMIVNSIPMPVLRVLAPTIMAIWAATKLWAAAQTLLDIALAANPVGLVAAALVALAAGLVVLWLKWDQVWGWMRHHKAIAWLLGLSVAFAAPFLAIAVGLEALAKNWKSIWDTMKRVVLTIAIEIAIGFVKYLEIPFLNVLGAIVNAASKLPGPLGAPFRAMKKEVKSWRTDADRQLHGLQVQLDVANAIGRLHDFKAQLALLHDKKISIQTYVQRVIIPDVRKTFSQHASGGYLTEGWNRLGEHGVEWAYKSGSQVMVQPTGSTQTPGGGGGMVLEIRSGGSKLDDLLVEIIRRSVRVRGGGDVQVALGRG
jgi:hypothetical protein